jgi:transposase
MAGTDYWAESPLPREQLVLFPTHLDEVVPGDAPVRLLAELLGCLDFSAFEARYHGRRGQPPIHPRVLAGALLYGLMTRVHASRRLEEALHYRLDFRWLAAGHTPDHTTLSEFRRMFGAELQGLFVQIGLLARELGLTSLSRLAFDGTRLKANNRRSRTRTPDELRRLQAELAARYAELEAQAAAEDAQDQEQFGEGTPHRLPEELADVARRGRQIARALAELERIKAAAAEPPPRLPLTDPEARVSPNKEGGFAVNYTPLAGVDVESGLIVTADVIPGTDEEQHLVRAVEQCAADFGARPAEVLADGLFATGANLHALDAVQVTMYSPSGVPSDNPAVRDDPTQAVPAGEWPRLPTTMVRQRDGAKRPQLDKAAFVYEERGDCYWCPQGRRLRYFQTTTDTRKDGTKVHRRRYQSDAALCATCLLRALCLQGSSATRQISRDQFEPHREALARRMGVAEGQRKYAERRAAGERPFGVIKQHFGVRQFLLRGLDRVRTEWRWLATAFNLQRLMRVLSDRPALLAALRPQPP